MAVGALIMFDLNRISLLMAGFAIKVNMFSFQRVSGSGMVESFDCRD
jgi:hypothetical protein